MTEKQKRIYNLLKEFVELAEEHNLKYSIFYGSLLGAIRHGGFIPWDDDVDLIIPLETFDFLKKHYKDRLKLNENSHNFLLIPKYSHQDDYLVEDADFLDLFIVLPTTKERIKKHTSLNRRFRYMHSFTRRKTHKRQWGIRVLKGLVLLTWLSKKYTLNDAIDDLLDEEGNKKFVITWPFKKDAKANTYNELDFSKCITHKFEDLDVKIIENWEEVLLKNYGENWRQPIKFKMAEHFGMYEMDIYTYKKKKNK